MDFRIPIFLNKLSFIPLIALLYNLPQIWPVGALPKMLLYCLNLFSCVLLMAWWNGTTTLEIGNFNTTCSSKRYQCIHPQKDLYKIVHINFVNKSSKIMTYATTDKIQKKQYIEKSQPQKCKVWFHVNLYLEEATNCGHVNYISGCLMYVWVGGVETDHKEEYGNFLGS